MSEQRSIPSSQPYPLKIQNQDMLSLDIVFALLALGSPRSGKTLLLERFLNYFQKNNFFTWWMFSASGHEALFPIVNFNCRDRWYEELQKHPERSRELPSCQCHKPQPILLMKPNYIELDKKSFDYGINVTWKDWKEYNQAYEKGLVREYIDPFNWDNIVASCPGGLFKKPKSMYPKQIFKVIDYTPPITGSTSTKNGEAFREDMRKAIATAKSENRILINSPGFHPIDSQGKLEKYSVIAEGLKFTQDELAFDPMFDVYDGDPESATPQQLANHKKMYMFTELRALAPSAKLSGEKESGVSKRALYNFMPVRRHMKTWVIGDSQSPSDIFDGVRNQFSELKVFKRITPDLIGVENEKFYQKIDNTVNTYLENLGINPKRNVPTKIKLALLKRFHICKLSELPDNYMCIKNPAGEYQFRVVEHPQWHHKNDQYDNIEQILGTRFTINNTIRGLKVSKERTESTAVIKSQGKEVVMLKIQSLVQQDKQFPEILDTIKQLELDGSIPDLGNGKLTPKTLNTKYNRWLKNQA